jgi:hypothetical protein
MEKIAKGLITAASTLTIGLSLAWAVQPEFEVDLQPQVYVSMSFGGTKAAAKDRNFFYGMRIDRDPLAQVRGLPPLAQLAFDRFGFQGAAMNGIPFAYRTVSHDQNDGGAAVITAIDWTLLAVGAIGIGYALAEVIDQDDSPDPAPATPPAGGNGSGGYTENVGGADPFEVILDSHVDAIEQYQKWVDSGSAMPGATQ